MRVLVVDSETANSAQLANDLARQGHDASVVADGREALRRIESEGFDVVFADIKTPSMGEMELLKRIRSGPRAGTRVVVMSANGSVRSALEAVRLGAFDFVAKPLTSAEIAALLARIERLYVKSEAQAAETTLSRETAPGKEDVGHAVVGTSEAIARVRHMIKVSSRTEANVLIYGETGVGKDLVASMIHRTSHRRKAPFVKVGCALFPASLFESELYGHEEGSFTGADQPRKGRFELAEGGTIYLDDVDDIPLAQQSKLLRAIEEKVFERVGGNRPMKANVRIIASSKKNLLSKIGEGTFRSDLYYRLDVLRIRVPTLRERREDLPALTEHLLRRIAGDDSYHLDPQAVVRLAQHDWPGNVRELYHALERAYLMGGGRISADLIEAEMGGPPSPESAKCCEGQAPRAGFQAIVQHAEKQLLLSALEACGGNNTAAAQSLGMKPSTFRDRLAKHRLP